MFSIVNSKGTTYHLYTKQVALKGQQPRPIYFFARTEKTDATPLERVPEGMEVSETKNGLPVLRRKR